MKTYTILLALGLGVFGLSNSGNLLGMEVEPIDEDAPVECLGAGFLQPVANPEDVKLGELPITDKIYDLYQHLFFDSLPKDTPTALNLLRAIDLFVAEKPEHKNQLQEFTNSHILKWRNTKMLAMLFDHFPDYIANADLDHATILDWNKPEDGGIRKGLLECLKKHRANIKQQCPTLATIPVPNTYFAQLPTELRNLLHAYRHEHWKHDYKQWLHTWRELSLRDIKIQYSLMDYDNRLNGIKDQITDAENTQA